jgi:hypothetical protein
MTRRYAKNTLVVLAGLALAALGVYNIVLKATWTLMDDGVFWRGPPGSSLPDRPEVRARARASAPATSCSRWTGKRS